MFNRDFNSRKRHGDFFSGWELERFEQLSKQFDNLIELRNLYSHEDAQYTQLEKALPAEFIELLIKYCDTLNDIITSQQEFFYRNGFLDCYNLLSHRVLVRRRRRLRPYIYAL